MSASAGCGTCAGLVFGEGCMNEGVDANGNVEVHVGWNKDVLKKRRY